MCVTFLGYKSTTNKSLIVVFKKNLFLKSAITQFS